MKIFSRYIARNWLRFFIQISMVLFILVTFTNLITGFLRKTVTSKDVLLNHILEIPTWTDKILTLSSLLATLFMLEMLRKKNELTAFISLGRTPKHFMKVIAACGLSVGIFVLFNNIYLSPLAKKIRQKHAPQTLEKFGQDKEIGLRSNTLDSGKVWFKTEDYFFSYQAYDKVGKKLLSPTIYYVDKESRLSRIILSEVAVSREETKKNSWEMRNTQHIDYLVGDTFPSYKFASETHLNLGQSPQDIEQIDADIGTLSITSLYRYIQRLKLSGIHTGEFEFLFWQKIIPPLICLLFALIPLGPIFNPHARGVSATKGITGVLIFAVGFELLTMGLTQMAKNQLIPTPVAIFAIPIALFIITYLRFRQKPLR